MSAPKSLDAYDLQYYDDAHAALQGEVIRLFPDRKQAKRYRDRIYGFRDALKRSPDTDPKLTMAFMSVSCSMQEQSNGKWSVTVVAGEAADPIHTSTLIKGAPNDPANPGGLD